MEQTGEQTRQREREAAIFAAACDRLRIPATRGGDLFGVSRVTFWSWTHGRSKVPKEAFIRLLEIENGGEIKVSLQVREI